MAHSWIARLFFLSVALQSCTVHAQSRPRRQGGASKPPAAAPADPRVARAEGAFKRAGRAFDSGDLATALAQYQESYALWPRPRTLLNLGVVFQKLGRAAEAANVFAAYLESDAADPARVDAVRRNLEELDRELGRVTLALTGAGEVQLDGKLLDAEVLRRPLRVGVGAHRVTQGDAVVQISVAAGQEVTVSIPEDGAAVKAVAAPAGSGAGEAPAAAVPAPQLPVRGARSAPSRYYLWTGAATLVGAGVTAFFAVKLRSEQRELDAILAAPELHDYAEAVAARAQASSAATRTNIGLAVTGVAALATVVMFVLYDRDGGEGERAGRALAPTRPQALLVSRGTDLSLVLRGRW